MESGFKVLGAEEDIVVLEIGTYYTKCGIGKETFPRSVFKNPQSLLSLDHSSSKESYYEVLRDFLNLIYFHKVQVNPKESVTIVSEPLMAPRGKIEAIVQILFEDLQVAGVCLMLEESLPLYTTGLYTGLMIDCGFSKTRILPIFEGIPMVLAYQDLDTGAQSLYKSMEKELSTRNPGAFSLETLEDICVISSQVRMCMISYSNLRQELSNPDTESKNYQFYPNGHQNKVTMTLKQRFLPDGIFFGSFADDENNIAASILKALLKCDLDTRKILIGRIVVSGGCGMIPGFVERLEEEILELIELPEFSKLKNLKKYVCVKETYFHRNIISWIGGSIASTLQGIEKFAIMADKYKEKGLSDVFGNYYLFANRPDISEIYKPIVTEKKRVSLIPLNN